jgi:dihydrofolate reductase
MGRIVYSMSVSLDGFVESPGHSLDWVNIDEELHAWFNDRAREAAAFVYGRRLYETMAAYWPHAGSDPDEPPVIRDFARIWNAKPKFVFSRTLAQVDWNSTLLRGDLIQEVDRLAQELDGDLDVGGPTLASELVRHDRVDDYRVVVHPVILGGGTPFFPPLEAPVRLKPARLHRFGSGAVLLEYAR